MTIIKRTPLAALLGLLVLILAMSACQAQGFLQSELPNDGPPIATSQAEARRFIEKLQVAGDQAVESQSISLTVTQEEVTSFLDIGSQLAQQLEAMNIQSLEQLEQMQGAPELAQFEGLEEWIRLLRRREGVSNISLSDLRVSIQEPQVYFRGNGHIIVRGYAEALGQRQALRLVMAPHASDGELVLDFVEGKLGPVPVPEWLVDQIGKGLSRLILAGSDYVRVNTIQVADGTLTLRGSYVR